MSEYRIEKNVPKPTTAKPGKTPLGLDYPIVQMEVGDSFTTKAKGTKGQPISAWAVEQRIRVALKHLGGRYVPRRYSIREETVEGEPGFRVWRDK